MLAGAALAVGAAMAVHVAWTGLTLSHYDAKAHLVVARRIVDSLMPGWVQIGAVWLPLPHLIQLLPTQIDVFYRTGAFAVGFSVLAFAGTVWLAARIVMSATSSALAATACAAVLLINPNVLYLQSTPMTEPLLGLLLMASVWLTLRAVESGRPAELRQAGVAIGAACLTRYEAWPVTASLIVLSLVSRIARREAWPAAMAQTLRLSLYPASAVAAFLLLSRATVGEWFVQSGFFVPENPTWHRPWAAFVSVWWGVHRVSSYPLLLIGIAGVVALLVTVARDRRRAADLLPLALIGAGALPWYAFFEGHPFRIRYMVVLIPVVALGVGYAVGFAGRRMRFAAVAVAAVALLAAPWPTDGKAPMLVEAQWDSQNRAGRAQVTRYLRAHWNGGTVMVSMGSLAHYMQELSQAGFDLRDFLHEGIGSIWKAALEYPDPHVEWILVEERAEGGDMLAILARQRPAFLGGYDRVAEGGGVVLFRRRPQGPIRTDR